MAIKSNLSIIENHIGSNDIEYLKWLCNKYPKAGFDKIINKVYNAYNQIYKIRMAIVDEDKKIIQDIADLYYWAKDKPKCIHLENYLKETNLKLLNRHDLYYDRYNQALDEFIKTTDECNNTFGEELKYITSLKSTILRDNDVKTNHKNILNWVENMNELIKDITGGV